PAAPQVRAERGHLLAPRALLAVGGAAPRSGVAHLVLVRGAHAAGAQLPPERGSPSRSAPAPGPRGVAARERRDGRPGVWRLQQPRRLRGPRAARARGGRALLPRPAAPRSTADVPGPSARARALPRRVRRGGGGRTAASLPRRGATSLDVRPARPLRGAD